MLFLAYALYHGLAEGAERAIIADLAERGGRGRAFGLYHGFVGVAALPAGLATGLDLGPLGRALGAGAQRRLRGARGALALFWLAFAGPLRASAPRPRSTAPNPVARPRRAATAARSRATRPRYSARRSPRAGGAARAGCAGPRAG